MELRRSAEEALSREKALAATLAQENAQIAPTAQGTETGSFWAVWGQVQPWLARDDFDWNREISKEAIKVCRHGWERRDSDGSYSLGQLLAAVNAKIFERTRARTSLQELLRSFNVSKKDSSKPRFEVLCRYPTKEDWHSYKECIFNLCAEDVTVVRVRAIQGYSTMITAELLFDSRTKVNTRYEQTSPKRITG